MRPLPFAFKKAAAAGGGASTAFITAFNASSNYDMSVVDTREAGYKFTVGGAGITVTELGFMRAATTFGNRTVRIRDNAGTLVASASVVYTAAAVGEICWATLGSSVALSASTIYHITGDIGGYNSIRGRNGYTGHTTTAAATINDVTNASQSNGDGLGAFVNFKYT